MDPKNEFGYTEKTQEDKPFNFSTGLFIGLTAGMIIAFLISVVLPRTCSGTIATDKILDATTAQKLEMLGAQIQANYYEDVDTENLREGLYKGVFEAIDDKYSEYYTAEEYKKVMESTKGSFNGIGIVLTQNAKTNKALVINVYEGSPAEAAGIKVGDVVIQVDDSIASSMDLTHFVEKLRGESGTVAHVKVFRESENKYLEFDVTREAIEYPTVAGIMLQDEIGYIRIIEFTNSGVSQFDKEFEELEKKGAKKFIIDLRNNLGGVLPTAVSIADRFLPEGIVVSTRGKNGDVKNYTSTRAHKECPLVVLVNEHSASAAEVFAGAIRDYKAGTLIGTTTYGKGVVQAIKGLSDGSAYKLTVARYYTPNGENIHGVGIKPDIELEYKWDDSDKEYENDYLRDNQVAKAVEILRSK